MVIGIGIDLVKSERIKAAAEKWGKRFLTRIFTSVEQDYSFSHKHPYLHLAGRFAIKEAVFKAIGTGWRGGVKWTDIEVYNEPYGWWSSQTSDRYAYYAKMVRAVEQTVHAARPEVKILFCAQWYSWRLGNWFEKLLAVDPGLVTLPNVVLSQHPYTCSQDPSLQLAPVVGGVPSFDSTKAARDLAVAKGGTGITWITEVGWEWDGATAKQSPAACWVSEAKQADYYVKAVKRALGEWGSWCERVIFYVWERDLGWQARPATVAALKTLIAGG